MTTHVSLTLGPRDLGLGSLLSDIKTTLRRTIGDVLDPLLKVHVGVPAGRRRPNDRTRMGSFQFDATATQERFQDDDIPTGKVLWHDTSTTTKDLLNDEPSTCRDQHDVVTTLQRHQSSLRTTRRRQRGIQDKPRVCSP